VSGRAGFLGLALLATLLLAVIALELGGGPADLDATGIQAFHHAPPPPPRVAPREPDDHTDAWLATVLARPLFSRDRRPTPVAARAGGGPTLAALPRLTGVIVGPFGRTAIFAGTDGAKPVAVDEGATLGPYKVESIQPDGVTVSGPRGQQVVTLSFDAKTREALAADIQRLTPQVPGQPPGQIGQAPQQVTPFNPQLRQNQFNLRQGLPFARPPGFPAPQSN
jgi:hypothetical protein